MENTLTDIWCLFDFVQPGLLGALKDFGNRYRRPIEAETDEEKERVAELKALIEPQKLRRTKAEVAKDLPKKIEVDSCRALPLSDRQRAYYADAVAAFRKRDKSGPASGLQSPLGLLQYLRRLCSDPRPLGQVSTDSELLSDIELRSPKMAWLMGQLRVIEAKGEKVIVFCEFRDLQRTLQRCIGERFGVVPDVINGDTSADSANANNRQPRESGEVVVFRIPTAEIKYFDSDTVSVLANISRRPSTFELPDAGLARVAFNDHTQIHYLLHEVKREKPYFEPLILRAHLESVVCVKPKLDNARVIKQDGAFLLFGMNGRKTEPASVPLGYLAAAASKRLLVEPLKKSFIRKQLESLGLTQATIFPEIDKVAEFIKRNYATPAKSPSDAKQ